MSKHMDEFLLYNSGILVGSVDFTAGTFRCCTIEDEQWCEPEPLSSADYLDKLQFDLTDSHKYFSNYPSLFASVESGPVTAPWGEHYDKENNWLYIRKKKRGIDILFDNGQPVAFVTTWLYATLTLVKPGYESAAGLDTWKNAPISSAEHHIRSLGTFMVPMRDGVRLATHVWLPADLKEGEKVPTILVRTPYNASLAYYFSAKYVRRGYALMLQDLRGREQSEGVYLGIKGEENDGSDTLDWMAAQPWSDGKAGTIGGSYCGFVQWSMAASGNPHLGCMVSFVTAGPPFLDVPRRGGSLACGSLPWVYAMNAGTVGSKLDMQRDDWNDIFAIRPLKDLPEKAFGVRFTTWNAWLDNETNNDYWRESDWARDPSKITAPALVQSGWFDDDCKGSQVGWDIVQHYENDKNKFLMMGPWLHKSNTTRDSHAGSFGNNAIIHNLEIYWQRWFDYHLKKMEQAAFDQPPVMYYMLGANEWRTAHEFPPAEFEKTTLYFGGDNGLHEAVPQDDSVLCYDYDPANPPPHVYDPSENELAVPEEYTEVEKRDDVLCFTMPITEECEIAGDFNIKFYAASSALDTDWIARVTIVGEDGRSVRLVGSNLRAKFRDEGKRIQLLTPGKVEEYNMRLTPAAIRLKPGQKLRVHFTSAANNLLVLNFNTGLPMKDEEEMIVAHQSIHCGKSYPSGVTLYMRKV